jgi:hypothetical protein
VRLFCRKRLCLTDQLLIDIQQADQADLLTLEGTLLNVVKSGDDRARENKKSNKSEQRREGVDYEAFHFAPPSISKNTVLHMGSPFHILHRRVRDL